MSNGEFEFTIHDPGTYVVEMVMVDGYVAGAQQCGIAGALRDPSNACQLPGRWNTASRKWLIPQNVANFLGMSAQTTMTSRR